MLRRRRNAIEVGWFGSKAFKSVTRAVSGAAKGAVKIAKKVPGVSIVTAPAQLVSDVARGRNVVRSIGRAGSSVVKDARSGLPIAAGVASFVPGFGTGVAAGLSAASALSQGKSLQDIATDAALGAVPGGQLVRAAVNAGVDVAKGRNVIGTVVRQGSQYAQTQLPGGQLVASGVRVVSGVAKGQNVLGTVRREGTDLAMRQLPGGQLVASGVRVATAAAQGKNIVRAAGREVVSAAVKAAKDQIPMPIIRPQFGTVASFSPENIGRVRKIVEMRRPSFRPQISSRNPTAPLRPLSVSARNAMVRAVPWMRREVSGLSETGAQWIVEKGDTGEKIALKLTGNKARWTELRSINPKVMARKAEVAKYGFPIYVGDVINLPSSWIKVSAKPPAQSAPATPSISLPPPVSLPGANIAAQGQARVILATWGRSDGAKEAGVTDYGSQSELAASQWTARDALQAQTFANWWQRNGGPPSVTSGDWSDALAQALNLWAEKKASQVTNSAMAAGGYVIPLPALPSPAVAPASAPPGSTPAQSQAPAPAPTLVLSPVPTVDLTPAGTIQLPQIVVGSGTNMPVPQATKPAAAAPMNDNAKWGLWSALISGGGAVAIRFLF